MRSIIKRDVGFGAILVSLSIVTFLFFIGGNTWFGASIGTLYLAMVYMTSIWSQLWQFNNILRDVNRVLGDAQEMTIMRDEPILVTDAPNAATLNVRDAAIEFRDISFRHTDTKVGEEIFHGFNLNIPAGQRVGLVGHSGSGKTTLTKLLLRFADVQQGEILIDGQNIASVSQESLRRTIAYVPQEPLLFHRTIAENISYGKLDATEDEIRAAAQEANALEFINKLPNGFQTVVGERGVKLSGGQRQRIVIARAILADAPILVLDEATSALDTESEKLIQDALANLMHGRTSLVIAHRLSTVANLDRIIVLDDGKIIEDGPHAELLKRGGKYAKLWNRQTGFAEE
jgi:ATP-binding cassette subfamily B protein